jgi:hypothetical protein
MEDQEYVEMAPDKRPQDPTFDGAGWSFELLDHGGEYPDTMPQAIRATDAQGRSCVYVPVTMNGHVVDSDCIEPVPAEELGLPRNIF